MAEDKNLFERLDNIESMSLANNKMLGELLDALQDDEPQPSKQQEQEKPASDQGIFFTFLKKATKCYRWFGTKAEFKKSKKLAIIANLILLGIGIVTSIVTSICFRIYSTFTFFENIWLIFSVVILTFLSHDNYINEVNDLAAHSPDKYRRDEIGMLTSVKTKTVFNVFKWLSLISAPLNIVGVWVGLGHDLKILASVVETLFLGAMIFALVTTYNFFSMYAIPWIEGLSLTKKEKVVLVALPGTKQLMAEEDFKAKMPHLYE